jgi:hypothetical protein
VQRLDHCKRDHDRQTCAGGERHDPARAATDDPEANPAGPTTIRREQRVQSDLGRSKRGAPNIAATTRGTALHVSGPPWQARRVRMVGLSAASRKAKPQVSRSIARPQNTPAAVHIAYAAAMTIEARVI